MFCKNCGKEIDDNAYVCPNCGVLIKEDTQTNVPNKNNNGADGLSIAALICSILVSIVGLILSIVSLNAHKDDSIDNPSRKMAKAGLIISIVFLSLSLISTILIFVGAGLAAGSMIDGAYYACA